MRALHGGSRRQLEIRPEPVGRRRARARRRGHGAGRQPRGGGRPDRGVPRPRHRRVRPVRVPAPGGGVLVRRGRPARAGPPRPVAAARRVRRRGRDGGCRSRAVAQVAGEAIERPVEPRPAADRGAGASLVGTTVEWYDFFLYTTAAGLVFGKLFFPTENRRRHHAGLRHVRRRLRRPADRRPVFGHIGDRIGRKRTLAVTMSLMGVATALIGLLPDVRSRSDLAPVLLSCCGSCRASALGGEWAGAVLLAVEHAPAAARGSAATRRSVWPSDSPWAPGRSRCSASAQRRRVPELRMARRVPA